MPPAPPRKPDPAPAVRPAAAPAPRPAQPAARPAQPAARPAQPAARNLQPSAAAPPAAEPAPAAVVPAGPVPLLDNPGACLPVIIGMNKMEEDAFARALSDPVGWRVPVGAFVASAVAFGLGSGSVRMFILRPVALVAWVAFMHAMALKEGGHGDRKQLFRVAGLVFAADIVAVVPNLGPVVALLATLWYAVVLARLVERQYQLADRQAMRAVLKGLGATLITVVVLSLGDAVVRGTSKWERGDRPTDDTSEQAPPQQPPAQ